MVQLVVFVAVVVAAVYAFARRPAHAPHAAPTRPRVGSIETRHLGPTSQAGRWSLGLLASAVVVQLGLSPMISYGGVPLAVAAVAFGVVALVHSHDRSPLLVLVMLVALFVAMFPLLFWLLS